MSRPNPFKAPSKGKGTNSNQSKESEHIHNRDDLDAGPQAHHHTLGPGAAQAAPGNHTHSMWSTGDVKTTYAEADNVEWFELNGQASPTPELEAMFGPNLPDATDRYMHYGDPDGGRDIGTVGGSFFSTITSANLPPHTHGIDHNHASFTTAAGGAHDHDVTYRESASSGGPQNIAATGAGTATTRTVATTSETHTHDIDVPAFTGDSDDGGFANSALIIVPPRVSLRFLVHA